MDKNQWFDQVLGVECWQYDAAFNHSIATRLGPIARRQGLILQWETTQGTFNSEAAPFPGIQQQTLAECASELRWVFNQPKQLLDLTQLSPSVSLAIGSVGMRISSKAAPKRDPEPLPGICRLISDDQGLSDRSGDFSTVKLKLQGTAVADNSQRIQRLIESLHPDVMLRLDCSGEWTPAALSALLAVVPNNRIAYIEDPFSQWSDYAHWHNHFQIPYALDEFASLWDPTIHRNEGLSTLVIKPLLLGLSETQSLVMRAQQQDIDVVLSSVYESSVQLNFYMWLAQHWQLSTDQGLDTAQYWTVDVIERPCFESPQRPMLETHQLQYVGRLL